MSVVIDSKKQVTTVTMPTKQPAQFMSQAEYARYRGVSRKTVTVWKHKGLLVLNGIGQVDVAATDRLQLDHFGVLRFGNRA